MKKAGLFVVIAVLLLQAVVVLHDKYRKLRTSVDTCTATFGTQNVSQVSTNLQWTPGNAVPCGTEAELQALYGKYNHLYFADRLPYIPVRLEKNNEDAGWYFTSNEIFIAPRNSYPDIKINCSSTEELYGETLIHEMAHAWVHNTYPDARMGHGALWKAEMRHLAGSGALDMVLWSKEDKP